MTWIVVDVEADGPAPGLFSMVCFGAVVVEPGLERTFYGQTAPITTDFKPEALAVSGFSREEHEGFQHPQFTMHDFVLWLRSLGPPGERLTFISDNPAFDWQFINYYLWRWPETNPFGFSARRIGDLYAGWKGDAVQASGFKKLRKTKHTHNPVDDARGNAEALLEMKRLGLRMPI